MRHFVKLVLIPFLLTAGISCSSKKEHLFLAPAILTEGSQVLSDTLPPFVKGSLVAGKTYYVDKDVTINPQDTLRIPGGVRLIVLGDGSATSPSLFVKGSLLSQGTADAPVYFSVSDEMKSRFPNGGVWGGIVGDSARQLVIKWTHIEYTGAPWNTSKYTGGTSSISATHYAISTLNDAGLVVIEDSWISRTLDDGMYLRGARIDLTRNTIEQIGVTKGIGINIKYGVKGDISYNLVINCFNSGIKSQSLSGAPSQAVVNVYNNTVINCGFKDPNFTLGGGISMEKLVAGKIYNNVLINNKIGLRILSTTDLENLSYGNNFFYGNSKDLTDNFYPILPGFSGMQQPGDLFSDQSGENNPAFFQFDPSLGSTTYPANSAGFDFNLSGVSSCLNSGVLNVGGIPSRLITTDEKSTVAGLGRDRGAFQQDGSGNQH